MLKVLFFVAVVSVVFTDTGAVCCNGPNEKYSAVKPGCPMDLCISLVSRFDCSKYPPPAPGCVCNAGYKRVSEDSDCVLICECPQMANSPDC